MAKSPRQTSDNVLAMPMSEPATTNGGSESMNDAVARRAYELYCARGSQDGHDVEDWLTAERELRSEGNARSEEHTSELQSHLNLVCRLLLEKKKINTRASN